MDITKNACYFDFLRYCLDDALPLPESSNKIDWKKMMEWAEKQGLVGVVFEGVKYLGEQGIKPPFAVLMQWIAESEIIKSQNKRSNLVAVKVSRLFEENGFRSCVLKGQGNAELYPNPYSRTPGDIDIWLEGGKNKILKFVNEQWPGQLERYHHVEIPPINGVPIEVHFMPAYMRNPIYNRRLQKWFAEQADEQFSHYVTLPDSDTPISIPTPAFNCIYQLQHMFSHLFTEGFGLRQVTDYYFVLKRIEDPLRLPLYKGRNLEETLKYLGLWKFARAMMWVMQRVYSLDSKYFIAEPDQKEGAFVLNEILQSGNMGHYDTRLGHKEGETVAHRYFRMTLRNMRFVKHYPSEALCEPIFRTGYFFKKKGCN